MNERLDQTTTMTTTSCLVGIILSFSLRVNMDERSGVGYIDETEPRREKRDIIILLVFFFPEPY